MSRWRFPRCLVFAALAAAWLAGCAPEPEAEAELTLTAVDFAELAGWRDDDQRPALAAFLRSCTRLLVQPAERALGPDGLAGRVEDWRAPCEAGRALASADGAQARAFFAERFRAFRLAAGDQSEGLFTGYYEPELRGARRPDGRYRVALLARPDDLVSVDLGAFRDDLRGQRIAGRVVDGGLQPYADRAAIQAGALDGRGLELVWVDSALDAFFLHIQGSGRVVLPDGTIMRLGYAAQNGRAYVAIGRVLVRQGALAVEDVSLQSIRAWLEANPDAAAAVLEANPSYVFFRELTGEGPIGAEGVALTAGRSLAVDRACLPLGVPLWLDADDPRQEGARLRRLVVAQDTGGAIKGAVRGDLFWGAGAEALAAAGRMKSSGEYYLLLPRAVADRR